MTGVHFDRKAGRFCARIGLAGGGYEHLGMYDDEFTAGMAWVNAKLERAKSLKTEWDLIDSRIYRGVVAIIVGDTNL